MLVFIPQPGIKPTPPALLKTQRALTTGLPGKSLSHYLKATQWRGLFHRLGPVGLSGWRQREREAEGDKEKSETALCVRIREGI